MPAKPMTELVPEQRPQRIEGGSLGRWALMCHCLEGSQHRVKRKGMALGHKCAEPARHTIQLLNAFSGFSHALPINQPRAVKAAAGGTW